MMRKTTIVSLPAILLVGGVTVGIILWQQKQEVTYTDENAGVSFQISRAYQNAQAPIDPPGTSKGTHNQIVAYFLRDEPAAAFTVRYESGFVGITNLLHRNLIEHLLYEIQQFFPIRYGTGYKSIYLRETEMIGRKSVEHVFLNDQNGTTLKTRIVIVPWDADSVYYFILQAKESDYEQVAPDLEKILQTLQLSGWAQKN